MNQEGLEWAVQRPDGSVIGDIRSEGEAREVAARCGPGYVAVSRRVLREAWIPLPGVIGVTVHGIG